MARQTTLKDLIDANILQVGEELSCTPHRNEMAHTAHLTDEGFIEYKGTLFKNPSSWATELAGTWRSGWGYVYARGRRLTEFKEQFEEGIELPQESHPVTAHPEPVQNIPQNDTHPANVEGLQSEVNTLKAQVASQQSAIASLNKKIGSLPASRPEDDAEDDVIGYLRERVLKLDPGEFERLVGEYLKAKGFSNVVVSGRSGDGGIDRECDIPFVNVKVAFQAKRYADANNIGIEPVQRLQGSMTGRFDRGIFITTSDYTPAARGWVDEVDAQITLINGDELMKEMVDLGLGVKAVTVVKHELDEGFFADFENTR